MRRLSPKIWYPISTEILALAKYVLAYVWGQHRLPMQQKLNMLLRHGAMIASTTQFLHMYICESIVWLSSLRSPKAPHSHIHPYRNILFLFRHPYAAYLYTAQAWQSTCHPCASHGPIQAYRCVHHSEIYSLPSAFRPNIFTCAGLYVFLNRWE